MLQPLERGDGNSTGNNSVFRAPETWVRTKNGVGIEATYHRGRPKDPLCFFSVYLKIKLQKPGQPNKPELARTVRLEIESPRHSENASLNDLKLKVIRALGNSGLRRLVREKGYRIDDSRINTSETQIKKCITVTFLKIVLDGTQVGSTDEETIGTVYEAVGTVVDGVLQLFESDFKECFPQ